jgi:hypothetical protein
MKAADRGAACSEIELPARNACLAQVFDFEEETEDA